MTWDLQENATKTVFVDDKGEKLTYKELYQIGDEISNIIKRRCLVFSFCTNTIGSAVGYVSFINHRIVPALLSAHMDMEYIEKLLENYRPAFIWIPQELLNKFTDYKCVYSKYNYFLLSTEYGINDGLYKDLGLLLSTSGSTGSPKFVRQSYENILSNAQSILEYLELDEMERPVTTLPMNYTYGLSIINSHILVGATILLTENTFFQKEFWDFVKKEKATSFGGVPYHYEILDKLRFFKMELPNLRYFTQAGGKLSPELHKKFAEYAVKNQKKFIVMYGQCEATARMGYLPAEKSLEKYGSMGIAIPGGKFSLIDVNGDLIDNEETVGELVYEGKNVTLGYAENYDDLKKGDLRKGKLITGDMAKRDIDGFYYIVGRKKRFLKVYGNRVNLDEIDTMIKTRFDNIECASGGIDDHVYVFVTEAGKEEEILKFVSEKTGLNHKAFGVKVINEIPKNDAGKIQYRELEKYYKQCML